MPIATAVAWFHDCAGGEFAFYPDGAGRPPVAHRVRFNTAILLDTDSTFHGVDRVAETAEPVERLRPGMRLRFAGDDTWCVEDGDDAITNYHWRDLRFSVSWKAYCFADEAERRAWATRSDDLRIETVLDRLVDDLRARGRIDARPDDGALVELLIDEYVRFPAPAPAC
jgi:hypothetical protein